MSTTVDTLNLTKIGFHRSMLTIYSQWIHCIFTTCSLYVHYIFTICPPCNSLYVHNMLIHMRLLYIQMAYNVAMSAVGTLILTKIGFHRSTTAIHNGFTVYSLHVYYMLTICSLHIHYMFTTYSLCSLHAHPLYVYYNVTKTFQSKQAASFGGIVN